MQRTRYLARFVRSVQSPDPIQSQGPWSVAVMQSFVPACRINVNKMLPTYRLEKSNRTSPIVTRRNSIVIIFAFFPSLRSVPCGNAIAFAHRVVLQKVFQSNAQEYTIGVLKYPLWMAIQGAFGSKGYYEDCNIIPILSRLDWMVRTLREMMLLKTRNWFVEDNTPRDQQAWM